jgi:hypothetical protein
MFLPVNAGASSWMDESSSVVKSEEMHMAGHDHEAMMDSEQKPSSMDAHDHGSEDCDDYCMNCSTHCTSAAIIPSSSSTFELDRKFNRSITGYTSSYAYLLYRPPISA